MPKVVALHPTTIRFAPDAMVLISKAADDLGISVSQFVREAAMMRAVLTVGEKEGFGALAEQVARLARRDD